MAAPMNKIGRRIQFWLWKTKIMHKCRVFQRIVCFTSKLVAKNDFILKIRYKREFTCDFCPLYRDWMTYPVWKPYWILERCHGDGGKILSEMDCLTQTTQEKWYSPLFCPSWIILNTNQLICKLETAILDLRGL